MHLNLIASQNSSPLPNSVKIRCKPSAHETSEANLIALTTQKSLGTVPTDLHANPVDMKSYMLWSWKTAPLEVSQEKNE